MARKPDFSLKVGDRLPKLEAQLINKKTGKPIGDLTGSTVVFRYKLQSATTWETIAAVAILNAAKAIVEVTWGATDTDTPGDYDMEFQVAFPTGQMSVPNVGCLLLRIGQC
jgi:hypothetical protein